MRWSVSYCGLLGYVFAIITYAVPIGQPSMLLAVAGLPMERNRGRWGAPVALMTAFFLWALFSGMPNPSAGAAFDERIIEAAKLWVVLVVAVSVLTSMARIQFFLLWILGWYILYPVRGGIFNFYVYGNNLVGRMVWNYAFENPNDLAVLTYLPIAIGLSILYTVTSPKLRWVTLGTLVLLVVVVFSTASRGAFVGLGFLGLLLLSRGRKRGKQIAVAALIGVLGTAFAPPEFTARILGLGGLTQSVSSVDDQGSADSRSKIAKVGVQMALARPITGVGLGEYETAHARAVPTTDEFRSVQGFRDAHNTFLRVVVETGFVGLGLFIALVATVFRAGAKAEEAADPGSQMILRVLRFTLISFLLAGLFGSYAMISFLYLQLAIIWSLSTLATARRSNSRRRPAH